MEEAAKPAGNALAGLKKQRAYHFEAIFQNFLWDLAFVFRFSSFPVKAFHQIVQVQALGVTEPNDKFPPAKKMLGSWEVFKAEDLLPPKDYIDSHRKK